MHNRLFLAILYFRHMPTHQAVLLETLIPNAHSGNKNRLHTVNEKFYKKIKRLGLQPKHVAEVGVYYPETSNILGFIEEGVRADLFEADPECVEKIGQRFAGYANVTIHPYAIYHERTTLGLYRAAASTFVQGVPSSPAMANDGYQPREQDLFHVEARLFSDFDDGTIDVLSIDVEGCEWYVLQHLVSRPMVISLEMGGKKRYINPHAAEISDWMQRHGYVIWYKDKPDIIYIQKKYKPGFWARITG